MVTPCHTPERCLVPDVFRPLRGRNYSDPPQCLLFSRPLDIPSGVIDPCEVGTTIPLRGTPPLGPSDVPGYGVSVPSDTASSRRKSAPLQPVCLSSVRRDHHTVPAAILPMSSFCQSKKSPFEHGVNCKGISRTAS